MPTIDFTYNINKKEEEDWEELKLKVQYLYSQYQQMEYMSNLELSFDEENMIAIATGTSEVDFPPIEE